MSENDHIVDTGKLADYLVKRKEWFSWYEIEEEPNSISKQLILMIFSEMSYRVQRQERDRGFESDASSPMLIYLTDNGYFSMQILSIRKLLEPEDNVISLKRALTDIKKNRHLITREIFVSHDGTRYIPGQPTINQPGLQPSDSPFSEWSRSTRRHELFDKLSGVSEKDRSRNNQIQESIFWSLENWLKHSGANELILQCNKYLAHAATAKSIGSVKPSGISFEQVEAVQRQLVKVSKALYDLILTSGVYSPVVSEPQLNWFGKVWNDDQLVPRVTRMQKDWDALEKIRNSWPNKLEKELFGC